MTHSDPSSRPARKRFGQNFLIEPHAIERIVDAVQLEANGSIIEIGPGHGALTFPLLKRFERLTIVELDRDLVRDWQERALAGLEILETDVRHVDWQQLAQARNTEQLTIVSNLPFNVSKPVALGIARASHQIANAVLMFQREVADKILAAPNTKAYGPLGILVGLLFEVQRLFDVSPGSFRPAPKVHATVTRWRRRSHRPAEFELRLLERTLSSAFSNRRKKLFNNLKGLGDADCITSALDSASLDGSERAEQIEPQTWLKLAEALGDAGLLALQGRRDPPDE